MKTIFITGASSGLGKAAAKLFQERGWSVIATMRNPEKETELGTFGNIHIYKLDVTDSVAIKNIIKTVTKKFTINVVLNNAGYGLIGPLEALSEEQISGQIQTNILGVIRVTNAFIPYFRKKKVGTFINISSSFGLIGFPTCSIYSATKFAVDSFSESLAYELNNFNIQVKIVAPEGIKTDFATRSMDASSHEAYQKLIDKVSEGYSAENIEKYTSAKDIAEVVYQSATDNKDQLRYVAGADAISLYQERLELSPEKQFQKIKSMFV